MILVYVLVSVMGRVIHRIRHLEYQFVFAVVTPPELLIEDGARSRYERRRQIEADVSRGVFHYSGSVRTASREWAVDGDDA